MCQHSICPFRDFVKGNLFHGEQGARWGAMVQKKTKRENEVEIFITPRSWRRYMALSRGHTERSRLGAGRERAEPGHMPLLRPMSGMLWCPGLRPDESVQTKKSGVLVSSKGCKRRWP